MTTPDSDDQYDYQAATQDSAPIAQYDSHWRLRPLDSQSRAGRRGLTVVVPVYGDWRSLKPCLESLERHTSPEDHVLIVNDCGPAADVLEQRIAAFIDRNENFRYVRNPENLGFVGTCNRAVLELDESDRDVVLLNSDAELTAGSLDELLTVLDESERHGAVCPRSDNATIATLPWRRHGSSLADVDRRARTTRIFEAIAPDLPRYYISPVAVGFCMLIRRSLIQNHGLFDTAFGAGYNEENDFCLRINSLGYSSVIANRALVFHVGSTSFGEEVRNEREEVNSRLLRHRYPFYQQAVDDFIRHSYTAIDQFADLLIDPIGPKRVLIDLHHLASAMNGSTRNALTFLEMLAATDIDDSIQITVAAQKDAIEFFDLEIFGFEVALWGSLEGVFDLGLALAPATSVQQLEQLNLRCARWLLCHLDVIAIRSLRLSSADPGRRVVVRDSIAGADRVVCISESTKRDTAALFAGSDHAGFDDERIVVIPQGSTRAAIRPEILPVHTTDSSSSAALEAVRGHPYVLVVGNYYPHKQVRFALHALGGLDISVVAFDADARDHKAPQGLISVKSGLLSDEQMDSLYEGARAVVFPSAYEGYGLPIPEALDHGTPVIYFDSDVGSELIGDLAAHAAAIPFTRFADLPALVTRVIADQEIALAAAAHRGVTRSITEYNRGIWSEALNLLAQPIDLASLRARFDAVRHTTEYARVGVSGDREAELHSLRTTVRELRESGSYRLGHIFAIAASPVSRVVRRLRS